MPAPLVERSGGQLPPIPDGNRLPCTPIPPGSDGASPLPSPGMRVGAPICGVMGFIGEDMPGEVPLGEPGMTTPNGGRDGTGADCVWV